MNWDWPRIKEQAKDFYAKASQVLVFLLFCFYILACVVAARPVTARGYVSFAYHAFQWQQSARAAAPAVRPAIPGTADSSASHGAKPSYIRTNQKAELRNGRTWEAPVVAVLDAGTPVKLLANFAHRWEEVEEIAQNGARPAARGYLQASYLEFPNQ
jgi:hypothetical protein